MDRDKMKATTNCPSSPGHLYPQMSIMLSLLGGFTTIAMIHEIDHGKVTGQSEKNPSDHYMSFPSITEGRECSPFKGSEYGDCL